MKRKTKNNPNKLIAPIIGENEKLDEGIFTETNNIIKPTPRKTYFLQSKNNLYENSINDKQKLTNDFILK